MKKLLIVVFTLLVAGSLTFAQNTGGDKGKAADKSSPKLDKSDSKEHKGGKKGHKGGKKSKKGSGNAGTTPPPK